MSSSERVGGDPCGLSRRWSIEPDLAFMLDALEERAQATFSAEGVRWPSLFVISGYRPPAVQAFLNPSAPRSLHTRCPALAADLRLGDTAATLTPIEVWAAYGTWWKLLGGIWGGDFSHGVPVWQRAGFPIGDFNHFAIAGVPSVFPEAP